MAKGVRCAGEQNGQIIIEHNGRGLFFDGGASPVFLSVYHLVVTDEQGCTATASVTVDVDSKKGPDIITPGIEDGKNDELVFPELEMEPAKSGNNIIIFNRWGQVVFKEAPYRNNWNGITQSGQELPEGTYYYVLTLRGGGTKV